MTYPKEFTTSYLEMFFITFSVIVCLHMPTSSFAKSISGEIRIKESQIETANSDLNNERKKVRLLERRLQANLDNTDKTRSIVMEERQTLRRRILSSKKEMKVKSHNVTKVQNEIIRKRTRLKLATNKNEVARFNAEIAEIELRKQRALQALKKATEDIAQLKLESEESVINSDPRIVSLIQDKMQLTPTLLASKNQLYRLKQKVSALNNQVIALRQDLNNQNTNNQANKTIAKPKVTKPIPDIVSAYVYVISGMDDPNIESSLQLKDWIESYGAKFIEGHWNNLYGGPLSENDASIDRFLKQFEQDLQDISPSSKLILIGHGLGGGAVIAAATGIAAKLNRKIDYLVALDPVGTGNLRANIVFETEERLCQLPKGDQESNNRYAECIKTAKPRLITANVANFYNRWQKDSQAPMDYYKELMISNSEGKPVTGTTSTGKFRLANNRINANQKREFFDGNEDAHQMILSDAANRLPNLLIDYVR